MRNEILKVSAFTLAVIVIGLLVTFNFLPMERGSTAKDVRPSEKTVGALKKDRLPGPPTVSYAADDERGRVSYTGDLAGGQPAGQGVMIWKNGDRYDGQWRDGRMNGRGTMTYGPDDDRERESYTGDFVDGRRAGQGVLIWKNGQKYEGQFQHDLRHGRGTMARPDGVVFYAGDFFYDRRHGQGTMILDEGHWYEGRWRADRMWGQGVMTYPDDDGRNRASYTGNFVDGKRVGRGTLVWKDGNKYEGQFQDDRINGRGVLTYAPDSGHGAVSYTGDFYYDRRHGLGVMTWKNGDKYDGGWVNDAYAGQGALTWGDGHRYQGRFRDGRMHGRGTLTYPEGSRLASYVGDFRNNQANGQGVMTWKNGRKYEGQWINNRFHGQGLLTCPPGSTVASHRGLFEDGRAVHSPTPMAGDPCGVAKWPQFSIEIPTEP